MTPSGWRVVLTALAVLGVLVTGSGFSAHALPRTAGAASAAGAAAPLIAASMESPHADRVLDAAALAVVPAPAGPVAGLLPVAGPLLAPPLVAAPVPRPPAARLAVPDAAAPGSRAPPASTGT